MDLKAAGMPDDDRSAAVLISKIQKVVTKEAAKVSAGGKVGPDDEEVSVNGDGSIKLPVTLPIAIDAGYVRETLKPFPAGSISASTSEQNLFNMVQACTSPIAGTPLLPQDCFITGVQLADYQASLKGATRAP